MRILVSQHLIDLGLSRSSQLDSQRAKPWRTGRVLGGRFVEPGRILNICSLVLRDPQQIVVWGLPTYYPLWLGGLWRLRSRIDCRVRIRTAIEALDVRWTVLCCAKHSHPGPRPPMSDVTRILSQIEQGDAQAAEKLLPLVYDELRKLAAAKLAQE